MIGDDDSLDWTSDKEPMVALDDAWSDETLSIGKRARALARYLPESHLTVSGAARVLNAPSAEIAALLELAQLDDEQLLRISDAKPPKTTWLLFSQASDTAIAAGLNSLRSPRDSMVSAPRVVYEAMRAAGAKTFDDRLLALSGETLAHLASKAKQYNAFSPKSRSFLGSVAKRRKLGSQLTVKQLRYLGDLLNQLADMEIVSRQSPDSDQEHCDAVLDAIGR